MQISQFKIKGESHLCFVNPEMGTLVDALFRPTTQSINAMFARVSSSTINVLLTPVNPQIIEIAKNANNIKKTVITKEIICQHIIEYFYSNFIRTVPPLRDNIGRAIFMTRHDRLSDSQCVEIAAVFKKHPSFERAYLAKESLLAVFDSTSHIEERLDTWYNELPIPLRQPLQPLYSDLSLCSSYIVKGDKLNFPPCTPMINTTRKMFEEESKAATFPIARARLLHDKSCLIFEGRPPASWNNKEKDFLKHINDEFKSFGTDVNKLALRAFGCE